MSRVSAGKTGLSIVLTVILVVFITANNALADGFVEHSSSPATGVEQIGGADQAPARAYFAGGCFWGVEYFFEKQAGVSGVISGYMGGELEYPTYRDVSYTHTNHVEVVEVRYDPAAVSYETLARLFFEIHDPTQLGAQGPDVGDQYSSVLFYNDSDEKRTAETLIGLLEKNGYEVATVLKVRDTFWPAEQDHQDYYARKGGTPYCHGYVKRF